MRHSQSTNCSPSRFEHIESKAEKARKQLLDPSEMGDFAAEVAGLRKEGEALRREIGQKGK